MHKFRRILASATFLFISLPAMAAMSPIALSIIPPLQFPPEDVSVTGLRLNILWGSHRNVYGFDFGAIGNVTKQEFAGIQAAGLFNYNQGTTVGVGLQLAGFGNFNVNKATIVGLQAALAINSNQAESSMVGLQIAAIANLSPHTTVWGVQAGAYNSAREVYGFQIGLINVTDKLHGLQIGLLNINRTGLFAVCPIINFGF